jgi:DNA-binding NarL/FixJ family response regulator
MEFKNEELVEREIEIAGYLKLDLSLKQISEATGLNKKILAAHIRNMMQKLKSEDMATLKKIIENKGKTKYKS